MPKSITFSGVHTYEIDGIHVDTAHVDVYVDGMWDGVIMGRHGYWVIRIDTIFDLADDDEPAYDQSYEDLELAKRAARDFIIKLRKDREAATNVELARISPPDEQGYGECWEVTITGGNSQTRPVRVFQYADRDTAEACKCGADAAIEMLASMALAQFLPGA